MGMGINSCGFWQFVVELVDMTRELLLELNDGIYCERVQRERKGELVDWFKKTLCAAFVGSLVSGEPESIKVAVTDKEPLEMGSEKGDKDKWVEVKVMRVGHYRWWWEFVDPLLKYNNYTYGMYPSGEDILMSIFPNKFDERDENGRWKPVIFVKDDEVGVKEHSLWVRVIEL